MKSVMKTLRKLLTEKNLELKRSIKMMKTQKRDTEKKNWLMNVKENTLIKLLNKMHKCNIILSYCLKRKTFETR